MTNRYEIECGSIEELECMSVQKWANKEYNLGVYDIELIYYSPFNYLMEYECKWVIKGYESAEQSSGKAVGTKKGKVRGTTKKKGGDSERD